MVLIDKMIAVWPEAASSPWCNETQDAGCSALTGATVLVSRDIKLWLAT
jgi:hypothetical protein